MGQRWIGQVDEHALVVARGRDPNQGADRLDVATCLADEAADVALSKLHLDGDSATAPLERLDQHLLRLLGQGAGYVLHQSAVVHGRPGGPARAVTPEA